MFNYFLENKIKKYASTNVSVSGILHENVSRHRASVRILHRNLPGIRQHGSFSNTCR